MYYIYYGISGSSLLIESTDSMISMQLPGIRLLSVCAWVMTTSLVGKAHHRAAGHTRSKINRRAIREEDGILCAGEDRSAERYFEV
jgi:hypothetical protein